ncbi:MAG: SET domain-containing protein-lysine N-methyltransferase [Acidimicrobiia bacterium]
MGHRLQFHVISLRSKAVERRTGSFAGVGLFANRAIGVGELLAIKGGRIVSAKAVTENLKVTNGSQHQIAPKLFVSGMTPDEVDNTLIGINHSCDPNGYVDGQIFLRARKPIEPGEEVTADYGTIFNSSTQEFICSCGSPNCRRVVNPAVDSNRSSLRGKYKKEFVDFLANPSSYRVGLHPVNPNVPTTSWVSNKTKRINSPIHGLGSIAKEKIKAGEVLAIRGGNLLTAEQLEELDPVFGQSSVQLLDNIFLAGSNEEERLATLLGFNHSCEPNAHLRGQITCVASKDIEAGEEITVDYATAYTSPIQKFDCGCNAPTCRKTIDASNDWQDIDFQKSFEGKFAGFIQHKIDGCGDLFVPGL